MARTERPFPPTAALTARARLLVVLPLTMALLVSATGFFAVSMASRLDPPYAASAIAPLGWEIALISLIAASIGLLIAIGVTQPVRRVTARLEALVSGELRGVPPVPSSREFDSLGGAFSDLLSAIQRYLLQNSTGAVITLDTEGRVTGSNAAAEAMLGYREADLMGRRFSDVFIAASGSRAPVAALEGAIARRESVSLDDVEIIGADGRPLRIGISTSYLQQGAGPYEKMQAGPYDEREAGLHSEAARAREVIGVMIAFKDLNQIRSLHERLRQADHLVALGTVTAGVAHEIRNPLASLRGLTELIGRDVPTDDPRREYVETMLESIDRLNRLIENLLLFSLPRTADIDDLDVADAVEATVSLARVGLGDRQVAVRIVPPPGQPLMVRGNRERLIQVFTNIVLNATQATPDGGVVTVRIDQRDGQATVAVQNTGSYIPPSVRRQLFVPFFTTKPTGTGLGLAIARQIVSSMDGRIEVESDPHTGTTFRVELPLAVREALVTA